MHTITVLIALAFPLGMIIGCMLGALAELTLNRRDHTHV